MYSYCVLSARAEPYTARIDGKTVRLPAGSFVTGRFKLGEELDLKPTTAWKRLKRLASEEHSAVTLRSHTRCTVVYVNGWKTYAAREIEAVAQGTDLFGNTSGDTSGDTTKESKKVKKGKKPTPPKPPKGDGRIKEFIDWWFETFKAKFQEKYQVQGAKDGQTVKRLLRDRDLEELKKLGEKFFASNDDFILQSGYTLGVFATQINKLLVGEDWRKKREQPIDFSRKVDPE